MAEVYTTNNIRSALPQMQQKLLKEKHNYATRARRPENIATTAWNDIAQKTNGIGIA